MSHPCWLTHLPFTTSTSFSSFTLRSTTTQEHAAQSGHHDLLKEHQVHHQPLQDLPVDKRRHQEPLWREYLQSGGTPRKTFSTNSSKTDCDGYIERKRSSNGSAHSTFTSRRKSEWEVVCPHVVDGKESQGECAIDLRGHPLENEVYDRKVHVQCTQASQIRGVSSDSFADSSPGNLLVKPLAEIHDVSCVSFFLHGARVIAAGEESYQRDVASRM